MCGIAGFIVGRARGTSLQLNEVARSANMHILDVRTPAEFATLHIPGSLNIPLDRLDPDMLKATIGAESEIYCVCQTGTRSQLAADMLRASAFRRVVHVDGGTNAWVGAGLPVERSAHRTISLERQVRIAAGSLMLLGVLAGALLHLRQRTHWNEIGGGA